MKFSRVIGTLGASLCIAALAVYGCSDAGSAPVDPSETVDEGTSDTEPGDRGSSRGPDGMTGSAGSTAPREAGTATNSGRASAGDAAAGSMGTSPRGGRDAAAGGVGGATDAAAGATDGVAADAATSDSGTGMGRADAGSGAMSLPTEQNSIAYIGCSMANNIGTGYKRVGGKVMWNADNYQTGAMVVQNWTNSSSSSWRLFDQKMQSIGGKEKVKAIMVQICIFSSRATDDEVKSMIRSVRAHTNPGTHIYLVGQPQYQAGHECTLAGSGGAKWTDDEAKKIAADASINQDLTYLGTFKLDSSKGEVSPDSCHASTSGEDVLGRQAMAFFGG